MEKHSLTNSTATMAATATTTTTTTTATTNTTTARGNNNYYLDWLCWVGTNHTLDYYYQMGNSKSCMAIHSLKHWVDYNILEIDRSKE